MSYTIALLAFGSYLMSFAGLTLFLLEDYEHGQINEDGFGRGIVAASIPVINTVGLVLCVLGSMFHWVSHRTFDEGR